MKKLFGILLWLLVVPSYAQFVPGQLLTAAELNTQFALYAPLTGATFSGAVVMNGTVSGAGITTLLGPYLTSSVAASTYLTISNAASTYLTISNAASTYLTQSNAATTYAPLGSPTFTGVPAAPTAAVATNTTQLATTAYVVNKLATPTAIGSGTANTGAFTTLSASSTVSGAGFSTYLASPPAIGGTAAAAGSFTTLSSSGLYSPSSTVGIKGTVAADSAQAGSWGEYASNTTSGTSLATGVTNNCTSVSLTAGDWDVSATFQFTAGGTTTITNEYAGVSTTSATVGALGTFVLNDNTFPTGAPTNTATPIVRVNVSSTTTVYAVAQATFAVSTMTCSAFIRARRVR